MGTHVQPVPAADLSRTGQDYQDGGCVRRRSREAAFADHGTLGDLLSADGGDADQVIAAFARAGVDTSALAGELQRQGADAFVASWQDLLDRIGARHEQLSR
jgi:hypothetical protein